MTDLTWFFITLIVLMQDILIGWMFYIYIYYRRAMAEINLEYADTEAPTNDPPPNDLDS